MKKIVRFFAFAMMFSVPVTAVVFTTEAQAANNYYTGAKPDNSQSRTEITDNPFTTENESGFRCTGHQYDSTVLLSNSDIEYNLKEIFYRRGGQ